MYIIINENDFNKQYKGHGYDTTDLQLIAYISNVEKFCKIKTETDLLNDLDLTKEEKFFVIYHSTIYNIRKQDNNKYTIYIGYADEDVIFWGWQKFATDYEDITNIFEYLGNNT